jgi:hypothetical protein
VGNQSAELGWIPVATRALLFLSCSRNGSDDDNQLISDGFAACQFEVQYLKIANPQTTTDFAELWVDKYAGEDTAKLEEMYRKLGYRPAKCSTLQVTKRRLTRFRG